MTNDETIRHIEETNSLLSIDDFDENGTPL